MLSASSLKMDFAQCVFRAVKSRAFSEVHSPFSHNFLYPYLEPYPNHVSQQTWLMTSSCFGHRSAGILRPPLLERNREKRHCPQVCTMSELFGIENGEESNIKLDTWQFEEGKP